MIHVLTSLYIRTILFSLTKERILEIFSMEVINVYTQNREYIVLQTAMCLQ